MESEMKSFMSEIMGSDEVQGVAGPAGDRVVAVPRGT